MDFESFKTKFWELSGIFLSVIQMMIALERIEKYKEKLVNMGKVLFNCKEEYDPENCDDLESLALKHRCRYFQFRSKDADFYNWYKNLPNYEVCESGIRRGKGKASQDVGRAFRKYVKMNNGYTPLAMVGKVGEGLMGFAEYTGAIRAQNHNAEMKRKMEDQLLHWKTIVSIPVEQEGNYGGFASPIKIWTESMANWGQGFNSGAAGLGRSLYGLLHSGNKNQENEAASRSDVQPVIGIGRQFVYGID